MKIPTGYTLDSAQEAVALRLQKLEAELYAELHKSIRTRLSSYFKRGPKYFIKGLYIYGGVGRGKTMLMDAFYDDLDMERKQRWHFHAFMQQQIHQRLKALGETKEIPITVLAREIAAHAKVLCFDEFHVSDIADAMILGRLFSKLFELGVVVVATSNQRPDGLYKDGLHRDRFLPFIEILKQFCPEVELNGPVDYRREILHRHRQYFVPADETASAEIEDIFVELSDGKAVRKELIEVNGRQVLIPKFANGVARVGFADMCKTMLGANDYLVLADHFHTVLLENVPVMDESMHNEAKRFITLIDILYDREVNLVISAAAEPDQLYKSGKNSNAFLRTASRLIEMTA